MGVEIERKFLVEGEAWKAGIQPDLYRQGYLSSGSGVTVRVRQAADRAFLTIKGPSREMVRPEFEYEIPVADAEPLLELCLGNLIEKYRYRIQHQGHLWEVDEFLGDNAGLVVAEIELSDVAEHFARPEWIGREVTGDPRYFNSNLVQFPYCQWPES